MALLIRSLEVIALGKIMAKELQVKNQGIRIILLLPERFRGFHLSN